MDLFECTRLHARISERQCKLNRNGFKSKGVEYPSHISCQGCAGLGKPAQVPLPKQEAEVKQQLKHIYCNHKGCYRTVKKEGEFCKKHQGLESQVEAGVAQADGQASPVKMEYDSEADKAALVDGLIKEEPAVAAEHVSELVFGLAALVRVPPHQQGLLIPFTAIELSVLASCEVSAEHIRELVLMGLAGQLVRAEAA